MYVRDVISGKVERASPDLPLREAARRMRGLGIGCIPVSDGARVIGMVTDRDIVCRAIAAGLDVDHLCVGDIMTQNVVCCHEDQSLLEVAEIMRQRNVRRLLVFDRAEQVRGIISLDDLCEMIPDAIFASTLKALIVPAANAAID